MGWFSKSGSEESERDSGSSRPELGADLRLERVRRAVRDFPGRSEADLARIIYGRDDAGLIADDARRLEAAGAVTRTQTGRLYLRSA